MPGHFFNLTGNFYGKARYQEYEAREISKISTTLYPGLLRLLLSESNKRRSPGYEVEISIKVILGTRLG
jgi:hypothetical protein